MVSLNCEKYEIYEAVHKQQGRADGVFHVPVYAC